MTSSSHAHLGAIMASPEGGRKNLNSELWHACAGPLISLPALGTWVVYFPQGHSEQVAASTQKEVNAQIRNYPNLPPQLVCQLHDVILHADIETDEVYCQMALQPVSPQERDHYFVPDLASQNRQPSNFFCKTLTASDTSTHGGFSIPRRAAEKVFPPLDYSQQPPAQEVVTRDLHDTEWKFRHIYRGQPKRHLLTTGWSVFVSAKRVVAGDAVLFIRNEKGHLFLGIRRANKRPTVLPSSVLSSDSMHIGVLAAAAHAASTNSKFTVFYNPRASPSQFVIPYYKYEKAVYHTRVSVGMRFRMLFEIEESSVRRYMGTITGISDIDPVHWPNSQWRSIKVGWDESTAGERQKRVSLWEIEPLAAFFVYPPSSDWRWKQSWHQPTNGSLTTDVELETLKRSALWMCFQGTNSTFSSSVSQGLGGLNSLVGSMRPRIDPTPDSVVYDTLGATAVQEIYPPKSLHLQQQLGSLLYQTQPDVLNQHLPLVYHNQQPQQQIQALQPVLQVQPAVELPMQNYRKDSISTKQPLPCGPANIDSLASLPQPQCSLVQPQIPAVQSEQDSSTFHSTFTNFITQSSPSQPRMAEMNIGVTSTEQNAIPSSTISLQSAYFPHQVPSNFVLHSNLGSYGVQPTLRCPSVIFVSNSLQDSLLSSAAGRPVATHMSASGFQAEVSSSQMHTTSQMNPITLPNSSMAALPTTSFGFKECSAEENVLHLDQHRQAFVGVDDIIPLPPSISSGLRVGNNSLNELVSINNEEIQDQSSGGRPCSNDMLDEDPGDNIGFPQQYQDLTDLDLPVRTYTKVYKTGSVGRSIDVTRFQSYNELRNELAWLFGLDGLLEDTRSGPGWQLVYLDKDDDWLLLGDDPWQVFITNVQSIRILSPSEQIPDVVGSHGSYN